MTIEGFDNELFKAMEQERQRQLHARNGLVGGTLLHRDSKSRGDALIVGRFAPALNWYQSPMLPLVPVCLGSAGNRPLDVTPSARTAIVGIARPG
jgi:hypothetical protein